MQSALRARGLIRFVAGVSPFPQHTRTHAPCPISVRHLCANSNDNNKPASKKPPNSFLSRLLAAPDGKRNPLLAVLGYYSAESRAIGAGNSLYKQALERAEAAATVEAGEGKAFAPRYEMLSVHIYLTLRRLRAEKGSPYEADVKTAMQCLFDVFWQDVRTRMIMKEHNMRFLESGKWIKECEQRFFGMALAFDEAWEDEQMMKDSISRNVSCLGKDSQRVEAFRRYMVKERARLDGMTLQGIWEGVCWDDQYPDLQSA